MFGRVTPEKAFGFTVSCARLGCCLPPAVSAGSPKMLRYNILWSISLSFASITCSSVIFDMLSNDKDISDCIFNVMELCPLGTGVFKLLLCRSCERGLQACVSEAEHFLTTMTDVDRKVMQRYADHCVGFYRFMLTCIILTVVGFCCVPIYTDQLYPTHASYPFQANSESLINVLRAFQVMGILQTGLLVANDFIFSALIWFTAARFEILSQELSRVSNADDYRVCIRKHQDIIRWEFELLASFGELPIPNHVAGSITLSFAYYLFRFAVDVGSVTRTVALVVTMSTAIGIITGSIQLIGDSSLLDKSRFGVFVMSGGLQLFVYSWPAERLIETSDGIRFSAYSSSWVDQSLETSKLLFILMERTRKSAIISVSDFLPPLSLSFYGSFLSTSFSYFTTIRAATAKDTS